MGSYSAKGAQVFRDGQRIPVVDLNHYDRTGGALVIASALNYAASTSIRHDEARAILDDWYDRYRRASRIEADVFRALENRQLPLKPGQRVRFQKDFQRRWLNGTYDGPVDNPDDPHRHGDAWVTHTSSGRRYQVFLSAIERREN